MKKQELQLIEKIEQLKNENLIMKRLSTTTGFYKEYFESLKNHTSKENAFNFVNSTYEKYFQTKKYNSFEEFKNKISLN